MTTQGVGLVAGALGVEGFLGAVDDDVGVERSGASHQVPCGQAQFVAAVVQQCRVDGWLPFKLTDYLLWLAASCFVSLSAPIELVSQAGLTLRDLLLRRAGGEMVVVGQDAGVSVALKRSGNIISRIFQSDDQPLAK